MQFISRYVFDNVIKDLKSELGINNIMLSVNGDNYFKKEISYSSAVILCGKGVAAWDAASKIRASKTIKSFQKNYNAECVLFIGAMGVPRVKLNY